MWRRLCCRYPHRFQGLPDLFGDRASQPQAGLRRQARLGRRSGATVVTLALRESSGLAVPVGNDGLVAMQERLAHHEGIFAELASVTPLLAIATLRSQGVCRVDRARSRDKRKTVIPLPPAAPPPCRRCRMSFRRRVSRFSRRQKRLRHWRVLQRRLAGRRAKDSLHFMSRRNRTNRSDNVRGRRPVSTTNRD